MKLPASSPHLASARFVFSILAVAGLVVISRPARAQSRARSYPIAPFRITERSGEFGTRFDYFSETQSNDGSDELELSNQSIQRWLTYRLRGYVYHPRFIDFRAQVTVGMLRQSIERSGGAGRLADDADSDGFIGGYDVLVDFLKEHPVSFSIFASQDRSAVLEIFTDRQVIETERYGGSVHLKRGRLPMSLSYSRTRLREFGNDTFSESTNSILEYVVRHEIRDRMRSELRYRYRDFEQMFRARNRATDIERDTNLRSHEVSLANTLFLTPDRVNYLQSNVRWFDQFGSQDFRTINWQEQLRLRPAANLRNYYVLSLLDSRLAESRVKTWRAEAGLDHQLYDSLDSHIDVHWRRVKFDTAEEREYGVTGRLGYRKTTPWGYLTAGYGITLDRVEDIGQGTSRPVIDEAITLNASETVLLAEPTAIAGTIVVTDATGLITYTEALDYDLEIRGGRIGIRIILTGLILDGDTVLVDYEFSAIQDTDYISDSRSFFVRHEFDRVLDSVLAVYYRWERLEARGAPSDDDFRILEFTDKRTGFSLRWRDVTWTEEYEVYDSNFDSFVQLRSQLEGSHRLGPRMRAGWNLGALMTTFDDETDLDDDQRNSDSLYAGLTMNGPIRNRGYWRLEGRWREETGRSESTLFGLIGRMGFQYRKVKVESGLRAEYHERFDNERDRFQFFMQFTREF